MVQGLKLESIHDYSEFIENSKEIQSIFERMPDGLSQIEKAYYIDIELGKLLSEDPQYVLGSKEDKEINYRMPIDEEYYGLCKSISELYVNMLKDPRIGIEADCVRIEPIPDEIVHVDTILKIDGKNYLVNIIADLANVKAGKRLSYFGADARLHEKRFINLCKKHGILDRERIEEMIKRAEENNDFSELYELLKNNSILNKRSRQMVSFIQKNYNLNKNLISEYGSLASIPQTDLEKMDKKFNRGFHTISEGQYRSVYFEDVVKRLEQEMQESEYEEYLNTYVYGNKSLSDGEKFYYKVRYMFNNLDIFVEDFHKLRYLEQNRILNTLMRSFFTSEEYAKITTYAVKVGSSIRGAIPLVRIEPLNEDDGDNLFYMYSSEHEMFCELGQDEIKDYFSKRNQKDMRIIGRDRTRDENLAKLSTNEEIAEAVGLKKREDKSIDE